MQINTIDEVVAKRIYKIGTGEAALEVTVLLGKPVQFPDSSDFFAPYQIKGPGNEKIRCVGGIDSFQSLQLAMQMIGYDLAALNAKLDEKLVWEGDENGALGF